MEVSIVGHRPNDRNEFSIIRYNARATLEPSNHATTLFNSYRRAETAVATTQCVYDTLPIRMKRSLNIMILNWIESKGIFDGRHACTHAERWMNASMSVAVVVIVTTLKKIPICLLERYAEQVFITIISLLSAPSLHIRFKFDGPLY